MAAIDDIIGRWVKRIEATGELSKSELFGKPLDLQDGYQQSPPELRMAHKVLKNAGYVPAEVEAMQRIADLREKLGVTTEPDERTRLRRELAEQQQKLALRLERQAR